MKKYLQYILTLVVSVLCTLAMIPAHADGPTYTGPSLTIDCFNPATRIDGTALDPAEISRVEYYISTTDLASQQPAGEVFEHVTYMEGGCAPMEFDLTQLSEQTQYYRYAIALDMAGRISAYSASLPFIRDLANPSPPVIKE